MIQFTIDRRLSRTMATFHPANHYASMKPELSRVTYAHIWKNAMDIFILFADESVMLESCQQIIDCITYGQCSVFYLRENTPLPCLPEEVIAHVMRILPLHSPDCTTATVSSNEGIIQAAIASVTGSSTEGTNTLKDVVSMLGTVVQERCRSRKRKTLA
ncbi:hypothetical protein PR048_006330, partial [Dryococelus australis]